MTSLTGLTGFDWALAQLFAISLALVAGSFLWRTAGTRALGVLVVPFVVGAVGCLLLAMLFRAETRHLAERIGERPASLAVASAVLFVGVAVADLLVSRVSGLVARFVPGRRARARDIATTLTLVLLAAVGLVGLGRLDERITTRNALAGRRLQPLGHLSRDRSGYRTPWLGPEGAATLCLPRRGAGAVERGGLENR